MGLNWLRRGRAFYTFKWALPATALVLCFQNCTPAKFTASGPHPSTSSRLNGENYDGKPFLHTDTSAPCPDKNPVRAEIILTNSGYKLVRNDCAAVSPALGLPDSEVVSDATRPALLTYKGMKFVFDSSALASVTPDLTCINNNYGPLVSVKLYVVSGRNGPMLTGYLVSNVSTYNMAFNATSIDTSSSAVLSAVSQDSAADVTLQGFDPSAPYPDKSNTKYNYGFGGVGSAGYISCSRPNGSL